MNKTLKISIIFLLLIVSHQSYTQTLSNLGFEYWEVYNSFNNPIGWGTSNFSVISVYSFNPVTESSENPHSGNSCARLETIEQNIAGDNIKVAGILTLGIFDVDLSTRQAVVKGGVPISNKPTIFSGYYKYSAKGIDKCIMSVFITKYNTKINKRDTLGVGYFSSSSNENWRLFEAPIDYLLNEDPDSMNIVILSSDTSIFETGSTLYIDDLFIDATVSSNSNINNYPSIKIFPNPVSSYLTIQSDAIINLVNIGKPNGVIVYKDPKQDNLKRINVSNFKPGLYFVSVKTNRTQIIKKIFISN